MEFALVLPILLLLVFGIINFGVVFAQNLAISNAARQAARFGAVDGHTCDSIIAEAEGNSASINLDPDDLVITVERNGVGCSGATEPCAGSTEGDSVDVTVTYDSPTLIPFPPFPNTIEIEAKGEFRCEFS